LNFPALYDPGAQYSVATVTKTKKFGDHQEIKTIMVLYTEIKAEYSGRSNANLKNELPHSNLWVIKEGRMRRLS